MARPELVIDTLYKTTIYDIATLTVFTASNRPQFLCYSLRDNLKLLPQDAYLSGFIPVDIAGELYIEEGITEENVAELILELVDRVQTAYLSHSLTASLPQRNLQHGLN